MFGSSENCLGAHGQCLQSCRRRRQHFAYITESIVLLFNADRLAVGVGAAAGSGAGAGTGAGVLYVYMHISPSPGRITDIILL